jgi:tuberous sclerosis protein 2
MVHDLIGIDREFAAFRRFVSQGGSEKEDTQRPDPSALPPLTFKRDRGHTISVMSPVRKPRTDWNSVRKENSPRGKDAPRSGINPR